VSLVPSLLQAIVHVDGEALVMHAGDKPYVVSPTGQVDLATRGLALDAVNGIVSQLLPRELQQALDELGAVQHELPPIAEFPDEHFTIVAARGGDDVWVEIRRRRIPDDDRIPDDFFTPPDVAAAAQPYPVYASLTPTVEPLPDSLDLGDLDDLGYAGGKDSPGEDVQEISPPPPAPAPIVAAEAPPEVVVQPPAPVIVPPPPPMAKVVAPPPPPDIHVSSSGLDRLLRLSAARGASTMYLSSDSRPAVRLDGELQMLEGEPVLTARDVESLLLTLMPERNHEALRTGAATEWILDIEDVGRVRCMSFRDHRGPGGVFRLMPTRSVSADQLGLPRAVQELAIEPEGLVLVAGARSSGKRTLTSAFVDLINRTRRVHVITIEREINIVHERGNSFISQREVRGNDDDLVAAARAALREDPDVLVIEELGTAGLMDVALEASASGHLVVGGFSAHTAAGTVDRIIDLYSPDHRRQVQLALARCLRGVVVQVLLKKNGAGRVPVREVLLNTPAVSGVIAEGKTSQLPMAIEGGRRYGMMAFNDALVSLVQQGAVDAREAYRYSSDRQGLLAALKRQGVDTSFVERLA
jgi:twitching motility protein PilT